MSFMSTCFLLVRVQDMGEFRESTGRRPLGRHSRKVGTEEDLRDRGQAGIPYPPRRTWSARVKRKGPWSVTANRDTGSVAMPGLLPSVFRHRLPSRADRASSRHPGSGVAGGTAEPRITRITRVGSCGELVPSAGGATSFDSALWSRRAFTAAHSCESGACVHTRPRFRPPIRRRHGCSRSAAA